MSKKKKPEPHDQNVIKQNKQKLLELAKDGADRPRKKNEFKLALLRYCRCNSPYDVNFNREIRFLRPDWFGGSKPKTASVIKKELMKMAADGSARPNSRKWNYYKKNPLQTSSAKERKLAEEVYDAAVKEQYLGRALIRFTDKRCKDYDANFDKKVRTMRSDWFKK
jgi:hypothetical protein